MRATPVSSHSETHAPIAGKVDLKLRSRQTLSTAVVGFVGALCLVGAPPA